MDKPKEKIIMLTDYKIKGTTKKITLEIESEVADTLAKMESFAHLSQSEIANTALKRFISAHKDFLPNGERGPKSD
jgi:hypothetical protein